MGYQLFRYEGKPADGTAVLYPNYYIRHGEQTICTETSKLAEAKIKVKKLAGEESHERKRPVQEIRVGGLLDLVIDDYKQNGQKSIGDALGKIRRGLRPYFGEMLARRVDSDEIERWIKWRASRRVHALSEREVLQPATINRERSLLRRAFQPGYERKPQLVDHIPPIKKLAENNTRKGLLSPEKYHALLAELPHHLKGITCIAYHVGNRKGELFRLEWPDVELDGNPPVFTLWPGETKSNDGRTLPILPGEMMDTFQALRVEHDLNWPKETHVFLDGGGKKLRYHHMREAWNTACVRAGVPGLLFRDLRRSAVRNFRRSGITQNVARQFSGHKTDSVFNRYNITDFDDLRDAAQKLSNYLNPPKPAKPKKGIKTRSSSARR